MTYAAYDNTVEQGIPVELYLFSRQGEFWAFTSWHEIYNFQNRDYIPLPVSRSRIKDTGNLNKDSLTIPFPISNSFALSLSQVTPEFPTLLTIYRVHADDPDQEGRVYWTGRVIGAEGGESRINVECESIATAMKHPGLRVRYELNCWKSVYSPQCGVDKAAHRHTSNLSAIAADGVSLTLDGASGFADGYFQAGFVEIPGNFVSRTVLSHTGTTLVIDRPLPGLTTGSDLNAYPGCDRSLSICNSRFSNLVNNGSFPYIPTVNPFEGNNIL